MGDTIRKAILVIHGIGQQRRFETLADFALGLIRFGLPERFTKGQRSLPIQLRHNYQRVGLDLFQYSSVTLSQGCDIDIQSYEHDQKLDTRISLTLPPEKKAEPTLQTDIYEGYWAPSTGGQTNILSALFWLIGTGWVALKNGLIPSDRRPRLKEFLRELFRLVLILITIIAVFGLIYWSVRAILKSYSGYPIDEFWRHYDVKYFLLMLIWLMMSFLAVQFMLGLLFRSMKLTLIQAFVSGVFIFGIVWWIWSTDYHGIINEAPLFTLLILLSLLLNTVFVDYMGDVQVYVSGNMNARYRVARKEILESVGQRLQYILQRKVSVGEGETSQSYYDEIIVAGHSLGSVIAYDLLNRILRPEFSGSHDARTRIKHLYTVGSPLDKIWYFFRDRSHSDNPIYQGILGKLKGRKEQGDLTSPFAGLTWTNIWVITDVVSGSLDEYGDGIENIHLTSFIWPPFVNHVRYWTKRDVMRRVGGGVF